MKKAIFILLSVAACTDKNPPSTVSDSNVDSLRLVQTDSAKIPALNLSLWIEFYQKENPDFSFDCFEPENTAEMQRMATHHITAKDSAFNKIYQPFLLFNSDQTKYIDFDSYQWQPDEKGNISFEADQKIVLVDLQKNSAEQIGFYGPSYFIEEGFWKNSDEVVLLGNSSDKVPFYTLYNLKKNQVEFFQYPDTLRISNFYFKERMKSHGLSVE